MPTIPELTAASQVDDLDLMVVYQAGATKRVAASDVRKNASARGVYDAVRYGAAGDGVADDASAIQAAFDAALAAGGGTVYLPPGLYRIARTINFRTGVGLRGAMGQLFFPTSIVKADQGVTAFRVWGAGGPDAGGTPDSVCDDLTVQAAGKRTTTSTCNYTAGSPTVPLLSGVGPWANGDLVAIEGVASPELIAETTATTTSGSPTVVLATDGDQTPIVPVGAHLIIGTAYPTPTRVIAVAGGSTLTMASNAASTLVASPVKYCPALLARVVSGAGTSTLTIDALDGGSTSLSPAIVSCAASGFDLLNTFHFNRVCVGSAIGGAETGFAGAAFAKRGSHANDPASNANCSSIYAGRAYDCRFGVYAIGADANASIFHIIHGQSKDFAVMDISLLGNTYLSNHADGGFGFFTTERSNSKSVLVGCYAEGGTFCSVGEGTEVIGGIIPAFMGGRNTVVLNRDLHIGLQVSGDTTYSKGSAAWWSHSIVLAGALSGHATIQFAPSRHDRTIKNATTGGFNLIVKTTLAANSVTITPGTWALMGDDGLTMERKGPNT